MSDFTSSAGMLLMWRLWLSRTLESRCQKNKEQSQNIKDVVLIQP